jgi:hypothetical protein
VRAYLSIHDCLFFLHEVVIGNPSGCFVPMIADHNLMKKSFGPMIADHDLVKKK